MKIGFFGHASYIYDRLDELKLINALTRFADEDELSLYFGGYGGFDGFCLECARKYAKTRSGIKTIFVTPYIEASYIKLKDAVKKYDEIIYPPLEFVPKKLAILKRNEWIVDSVDFCIVYVNHTFGGAFSALQAIKKAKKPYINLCSDFLA